MTLIAPINDFPNILSEIGQSVTIRTIIRTLDSNGNITSTSTSDIDSTAVVQEVSYKEKIFLQMSLVQIGDLMFFFAPDQTINIYDQLIWNATTYKIRQILLPPRIAGTLLFKQVLAIRDSA